MKTDQAQRSPKSWGNKQDFSVLIIDEANRTRAQITQMLRQSGMENTEDADNGKDAMQMLAERLQKGERLPDLIVYNVGYEIEDRVQFCVKLRELDRKEFKKLPIILLSSAENERLNLLVEHIGVARVVVRPVSPAEMEKHVQYMIALSRA